MKFKITKKAIVPIVASFLLLSVSVGFFVYESSWFQNYQTSFFSNLEENSSQNNYLKATDLSGNNLYLEASKNSNLTILKIYDKNQNLKCELSEDLLKGINILNISSCNLTQAKAYNIYGLSSSGLSFEKNLILK